MKTPLRILLSLAVAALLVGALAVWGDVDPVELAEVWGRLPLSTFATAVAIHAGIYLLRALRFRVLIPPASRPSLGRVLPISAAHNLAAYVLPAKTGEASLIVYLRGLAAVPTGEAVATLLVSRLVDFATLAGGMGLACLVLGLRGGPEWMVPLGGVLLAVTIVFAFLSARGDRLMGAVAVTSRLLRLDRLALGQRVLGRTEEVAEALRHAGAGGRLYAAAALSIPLWLGVFAFYAVLVRGLGVGDGVGLVEATFGSGLAVLSNMLPINGFAGFGTQEAGWVVGFGALGVERDVALASGLGAHLVQLFDTVMFGIAGHVAMAFTPGLRRTSSSGR